MPRWFLSYHSSDQTLAEQLKVAIERKDPQSHVFFAPQQLRVGRSWSMQLADEIAQADAFILLIAEKGVGDWQGLEYEEALDKWTMSRNKSPDFPLIVVLLQGQTAPGLPFLRRMQWIVTPDPASELAAGSIFSAAAKGDAEPSELWRHTSPYRGLEALEERDSDYFFGRTAETVDILKALVVPARLPILIGNSGVGKSSLARAGVLAALRRQAWPEHAAGAGEWPGVFKESRQWWFVSLKPGTDPLKALVDCFLDGWLFQAEYERVKERNGWIEMLLDGKATLSDLIEATGRRRANLDQPRPPAFLLYVDQGEELYVRSEERQRQRFSELLAQALPNPLLRIMMSLRSDFLGHLQKDAPLFNARHYIDVPPLGEAGLREIVSSPAQLLGAKFENEGLIDIITRRAAEDSIKDVGALPLLSYTLDDMWKQMVARGDGVLRLPVQSFELGGVLVSRADAFLATHPGAEIALRRILTLRLADVRGDGEPTRRRANRNEFSDQEWRLVSELADYPNRLLVTVTTADGETYAEVAHEAIFRRWANLRNWIAAEREFLIWRSGLEAARRAWQETPDREKDDALLMGLALTRAEDWLSKRKQDLLAPEREFITASSARNNKARSRERIARIFILVLLIGTIAGLLAWINQGYIREQWTWYRTLRPFLTAHIWPFLLSEADERKLQSGGPFRECGPAGQGDYCPEMVVVPEGSFTMGRAADEQTDNRTEVPSHSVRIARKFAVSRFEVTFDEWEVCVLYGDCNKVSNAGWGNGRQPVINVGWEDARQYVSWLSKMTGKPYRLLSEAEYEYAARGGTISAYPWGPDFRLNGKPMANCDGCGSQWDNARPAPVGSFEPNGFGLYDMVGNVWQWVDDCYHPDYNGVPPSDGSVWPGGDCNQRVVRGGAWDSSPSGVRSAHRYNGGLTTRNRTLGFRVARTLLSAAGTATGAR